MNQRGSVTVEYALLLSLVAVGCLAASIALAPPFLAWYRVQRAVLLLSFPP